MCICRADFTVDTNLCKAVQQRRTVAVCCDRGGGGGCCCCAGCCCCESDASVCADADADIDASSETDVPSLSTTDLRMKGVIGEHFAICTIFICRHWTGCYMCMLMRPIAANHEQHPASSLPVQPIE